MTRETTFLARFNAKIPLNKQKKYQNELNKINSRLNNKGFILRAPKHIVDQEKTNYNNLKNDIKKVSLTVKNL